ncbi:MAG: single-stranded-DNA-specific exonuclease RecJ [Oscillospiraceae bacterium]|nr:single-stranded-DNA-specific exonuclease RecJ [Oscillospiraceae bacterium]
MRYMKKWKIHRPDPKHVAEIKAAGDLSEICCRVLVSQGYIHVQQTADVLSCQQLSDPFLICDMQKAADLLNQAIEDQKKICIYGDYDCDGVMSTVILYSFLAEMGADVSWRIPERSEGYGLNAAVVQEMHDAGTELIVTVDNGISAIPEAKLIQELGMELIITDHHQPGEELPEALAIVDAHRMDNVSPFRLYCGAEIALLLVAAMNDGDLQMAMEQFGDLAAIATIADVVSLTGENRFLVSRGLEYLENTERAGLIALREVSGLSGKPLDAGRVAFGIAPRINAAGRMASPKLAVELMLTEDPEIARDLAERLNQINAERKETEAEIVSAIEQQIRQQPGLLHERVLLFVGKDWHAGVIGIVASRMQERYGKPCFVMSVQDGHGHCSARSFGRFHIFNALTACADLLEKFGGHPSAGGFSLKEENIPAFREALQAYAAENYEDMPFLEVHAACPLEPAIMTPESVNSLQQLAPFGADNPEPVFLAENVLVQDVCATTNGAHTKITIRLQNQNYKAMFFGRSPEQTGIFPGRCYHMLVRMKINEYQGRISVGLTVQDVRPAGLQQIKVLNAMQIYDKYCRGEHLPREYYQAMCPGKSELVMIYQEIKKRPVAREDLAPVVMQRNMNYCKLLIALDIFQELELITYDPVTDIAECMSVTQKADLEKSGILRKIREFAGMTD